MKIRVLEDGSQSMRFVLEVSGENKFLLPSPPPSFSELPTTGERKTFFRDLGNARIEEIKKIVADWAAKFATPFVDPRAFSTGTEIEIKGQAGVRVKSPKKK